MPGGQPFRPVGAQGYGPMGYPPPAWTGPPANNGPSALRVLATVGLVFVLIVVVLVGAVTLLGKSASSKFSKIETALPDTPSPAVVSTTAPPLIWTPWQPADASFTVSFPGSPQVQPIDVSGTSAQAKFSAGQLVMDETRHGIYFLVYFDLAPNYYYGDTSAALNGAVDGFVKSMAFTFTKRDTGQFAGMPSLEFAGTDANTGDPIDVHGTVIISGKRVYLFATGTTKGQQPLDFDTFIGSFHIAG